MPSNPAAPWPNAAPPLSVALHPGLAPGGSLTAHVEREGDTLRLRLGPPSQALLRLVWAFEREGRKLVFVQAPESGAPLVAAEVRATGNLTALSEADLEALRAAPGPEALRLLLMKERAVNAELEAWVAALFRDDPARGTSPDLWRGRLTARLVVGGVRVKTQDAAGIDEVERRADLVPNVRLGYQGQHEWFRVLRVASDASGAYLVLGPIDGSLAEAHPVVALAKSWSVEALTDDALGKVEPELVRALLEDRPATAPDLDDIRGLVNLGGPRVPGSFAITDRGEAAGEIVLRGRQQFGASQRRHDAEYLVRTLFEHGGRGYAVLHLPRHLADKDEVPPRILARVDGRSLLVFPDDEAWREVAPAARQAMAACRPLDRELVSRIFGASLVSTASLPGIPVAKAEPASLAPTARSTSIEVSHRLGVPVLLEGPSVGRTIVWRGIPLAAPPRLETIESGATVPILQRFVHRDVPYLRIQHPGQRIHCDYALRWISGELVLLQIAHGWPGPEARRLVVAKRLDENNLQTLHMRESLRALGQIYPEMERGGKLTPEKAAEVFGPMGDASTRLSPVVPPSATAVTQRLPEVDGGAPTLVGAVLPLPSAVPTSETLPPTTPPPELAELLPQAPATAPEEAATAELPVAAAPEVREAAPPAAPLPAPPAEDSSQPRTVCVRCEKPVGESDASCPHCGVSRLAPPCPHCGKPVSKALEMRAWLKEESGHYPWHARWDRRCASCGFEFARRLKLPSGHAHFGSTGEAALAVEAGESAYSVFDFWDHLPTVTVSVRRASPRSDGKPLGDLPGEQQITLTPEEWRAVIDQLEGPLKPLLERRRWSRDTT